MSKKDKKALTDLKVKPISIGAVVLVVVVIGALWAVNHSNHQQNVNERLARKLNEVIGTVNALRREVGIVCDGKKCIVYKPRRR